MRRELAKNQQQAKVSTENIPTFSLGPAESDSELEGDSSDASSLSDHDGDANVPVAPLPEPVRRTKTVESDRTVKENRQRKNKKLVPHTCEYKDGMAVTVREWDSDEQKSPEKPKEEKKAEEGQTGKEKGAGSGEDVASSEPKAGRPKPSKHISWTGTPIHFQSLQPHKQSSSTSTNPSQGLSSGASSPGYLSPQSRSPNASSSNLTGLAGSSRSSSAKSLKSLGDKLRQFEVGEHDPKKMRPIDATLANSMVFGGLKLDKEGQPIKRHKPWRRD